MQRDAGKVGIGAYQPVMEGEGLRFGGEVLEGVHASGAEVAVHGPERGLLGLTWLYDLRSVFATRDHGSGLDFKAVEIPYVPHPVRREDLGEVYG